MSGAEDQHETRSSAVGSLGEEAAKLLGALATWAREQDVAGQASTEAGSEAGPEAGPEVGPDTGAGADAGAAPGSGPGVEACECRYCPVCRGVRAVRHLSPEVRIHLASAATSLARAAEAMLGTDAPTPGRAAGVERIDLDGWDEPDDDS